MSPSTVSPSTVSPSTVNATRSPARGEVVATLDQVSFGYRRDPVLDAVSLEIRQGDYLAVLGPNGGGKSTLLRLLLGLETPWSGTVKIHLPGGTRDIGYVPQFATFDRRLPLSVAETARMGRLGRRPLLQRFRTDDDRATANALERLGLTALAKTPISELSGGQLQRTLIARALAGEPKLLLLDEPAASIDAESKELLQRSLRELQNQIPIVVVTHDLTLFSGDFRQVACLNRKLHYHDRPEIPVAALEEVYGCQVDLLHHLGLGDHHHHNASPRPDAESTSGA